jgi:hypothetical protein
MHGCSANTQAVRASQLTHARTGTTAHLTETHTSSTLNRKRPQATLLIHSVRTRNEG